MKNLLCQYSVCD